MLLAIYCIYDVVGLVSHGFALTTPLVIIAFVAMGVVAYFKPRIDELIEPHLKWAKPLMCVALVMVSLFIMERAYVTKLAITLPYILLNLCILGVLFGIVYFLGQRTRGAAVIVLTVCFIYGIANYFLIQFKGQPVMPADLFALGTASAVSQGYVYSINDSVAVSYAAYALGLLIIMFFPKVEINRKRVTTSLSAAVACTLLFTVWFSTVNIEEDYESYFYMFRPQLSYADYGSLLCFLSLVQQINPPVPDDFSSEEATGLLDSYEKVSDSDTSSADNPSVVVVMNETFSDLSIFDKLGETYSGPEYYQSIDDAILKGDTYVSVLGGGTCNSEFEFLTGASMANLGSAYPYMNYDLSSAGNMARQLSELGYDTTAIHPDKATNWKRNIVYDDLGFDTFIDESSFEGAQTMRAFTRDKATYEVVLETLESSDDPQFIFDVTIQNHGGYSKGGIPRAQRVEAPIDGLDHPELNEYLSSLQQSDEDLRFLIEELSALDEPVILCFFGDHQPSIMNWLCEYLGYDDLKEAGLEEQQMFYRTPYMVWANYEVEESVVAALVEQQLGLSEEDASVAPSGDTVVASADATTAQVTGQAELIDPAQMPSGASGNNESLQDFDTSLNYLGALVMKVADLPTSSYQEFLLELHREMPVINTNGYSDSQGVWYRHDEEGILLEQRRRYTVVQYDHLFGETK